MIYEKEKYKFVTWAMSLAVFVLALGVYLQTHPIDKALGANSAVIDTAQKITINTVNTIDLLTSTSTDATSTGFNIWGAKKVTIYATVGGHVGTTSAKQQILSITGTGIASTTDYTWDNEATSTGAFYTRLNSLITNLTNTNSQTLTRVSTVYLSATTTVVSIDLDHDVWYKIRCHIAYFNKLGDTGQGASCRAIIQY